MNGSKETTGEESDGSMSSLRDDGVENQPQARQDGAVLAVKPMSIVICYFLAFQQQLMPNGSISATSPSHTSPLFAKALSEAITPT
jgi:hypothetical protein